MLVFKRQVTEYLELFFNYISYIMIYGICLVCIRVKVLNHRIDVFDQCMCFLKDL